MITGLASRDSANPARIVCRIRLQALLEARAGPPITASEGLEPLEYRCRRNASDGRFRLHLRKRRAGFNLCRAQDSKEYGA
jgi:hypothetical protein